ncbi:lysophospholipid acyltransferase family protein [Pararoseomonas indoligenes]|uniref:1-acyl-sn-glycerol-3-phosphate acyltransferase n=1 Tax=Roseomonas indoligenes TaxID=2820811 RepID=A0A940S900_9PROT|nr:lysophospholipid acyltransferase family protein [Pararoseomonas indoligenes]MBP0496435.1 1-acyl-sn-glycerol-3-phosphate acyltransferase [Pararoseomonas indoligenes]
MDAATRDPAEALAAPSSLRRRAPLRYRRAVPGGRVFDVMGDRPLGGRFRAVRRLVTIAAWTLAAMPVQAVLLALPGRGKVRFARFYWQAVAFLMGIRIQVAGERRAAPRTLYLANHSSWLDIIVLGATLDAAFVSKAEVGRWPLIGLVARLGRTVFVSRSRGRTGEEAKEMRDRLARGDSLVLFPEGTSSDGTRVLPFRSSFLAVADAAAVIQPVSLGYDRLGGLPACRRDRPVFAWYGDMSIGPHAWNLLRYAGLRATVLLHAPLEPGPSPNRKALSAAMETTVAEGAAILRQNRPPVPLPARWPQPA